MLILLGILEFKKNQFPHPGMCICVCVPLGKALRKKLMYSSSFRVKYSMADGDTNIYIYSIIKYIVDILFELTNYQALLKRPNNRSV